MREADQRSERATKAHRATEILDGLLEGWFDYIGDLNGPPLKLRHLTRPQMVFVMSLTAHVHATAKALRPVLPDGLTIAHMPLVRSIFEATVTAVWCQAVDDGAEALMQEGDRQRNNVRRAVGEALSVREMERVATYDLGALISSSTAQGRSMEKRLEDLEMPGAYVIYRVLSGQSHASIETMENYVDQQSFTQEPLSIKSNPGAHPRSAEWIELCASCLVWSGALINFHDPARSRRSELRQAARELQIDWILKVKPDAVRRGGGRPR
ncbi:DUF5677 domain-containing protein [Janibacter melonis]|uniref:DUF5677 domain-containing protein n=1 Tax=Janibacter melonis TaxID=262209 RepID=UPI0031E2C28C